MREFHFRGLTSARPLATDVLRGSRGGAIISALGCGARLMPEEAGLVREAMEDGHSPFSAIALLDIVDPSRL